MKGIKQVKNYRLLKEIGKGQTGTVYEAVDDTNGRKYAIKSIPSSKLENKRIMDTFKKELKVIHGLNHNNIIKIIGLEKTVNNTYLVLEYCNGGSLKDYISFYHQRNNNLLPEIQIQFFIRQLTQGMEYMVKNKIIKRDLKLENIFLNFASISNIYRPQEPNVKIDLNMIDIFDSVIKIGDIGYSMELDTDMKYSTICGNSSKNNLENPNYSEYNNSIHLWSLGAITYEMLFGLQISTGKILSFKEFFPEKLKISLEIISFINSLLNFKSDKRLSWDKITTHPFIVNNINTFTYVEVEKLNVDDSHNIEERKGELNNFLWINLRSNLIRGLDEIMNKDLKPIVNEIPNRTITNDKEDKEENKREEDVINSPNTMVQNNIKYDHKGDIGLIINNNIESENTNQNLCNLNQYNSSENDIIEERNEKITPNQSNQEKRITSPIKENKDTIDNENVNLEKDLNKDMINADCKKEKNLMIIQKNITNVLSDERDRRIDEENSKNNINIDSHCDSSLKRNIDCELENNKSNQDTPILKLDIEKEEKLSKFEERNVKVEDSSTKDAFIIKKSIPGICIFKESKYLNVNVLNENSKDEKISCKNSNEEEKKSNERINKEFDTNKEAKDFEFKGIIDDKDNILKELLNKNFPYSDNDISNQNKDNFIENPNKKEVIEEEDLWEIISSKSVDNNVNINIEVEGGLKDNLIILDYFK